MPSHIYLSIYPFMFIHSPFIYECKTHLFKQLPYLILNLLLYVKLREIVIPVEPCMTDMLEVVWKADHVIPG